MFVITILSFLVILSIANAFFSGHSRISSTSVSQSFKLEKAIINKNVDLKMGFIDDAFRFFTNLNKEASAKHILVKGSDAVKKLELLKLELVNSTNISEDFSKLAAKVSIVVFVPISITNFHELILFFVLTGQ